MNKKLFLIFMASILLVGCRIKTPEELIEPPEVNEEKKRIVNISNSFMPLNAEVLSIAGGNNPSSNTESFLSVNLDNDESNEEIVVLYRDKSTREIGLFILASNDLLWSKKYDIKFESTDISDYFVTDLDGDGKSEIIVGYYQETNKMLSIITNNSEDFYSNIFPKRYLALNFIRGNDGLNIVISTPSVENDVNNNKFVIFKYQDNKLVEIANKSYDKHVNIYNIEYGSINKTEMAYILDIYKDMYKGYVDILKFEKDDINSILTESTKAEITQEVLSVSTDVNEDGILDINSNRVIFSNAQQHSLIQTKFYNVLEDRSLSLIKNVFEDYNANIRIDLKTLDIENIVVDKDNYMNIKMYYVDSDGVKNEFLELINIDASRDLYDTKLYDMVLEKNGEAIISRLQNIEGLKSKDRVEFAKIYDFFSSEKKVIRFIE